MWVGYVSSTTSHFSLPRAVGATLPYGRWNQPSWCPCRGWWVRGELGQVITSHAGQLTCPRWCEWVTRSLHASRDNYVTFSPPSRRIDVEWHFSHLNTHTTLQYDRLLANWHHTVIRMSVRLSVTKCIVALRVGDSSNVNVVFLALWGTSYSLLHTHTVHFCCRIYLSHSDKPKRRNFGVMEEPWVACSSDHGYNRRAIFSSSVLQLNRTSHAVRSAS